MNQTPISDFVDIGLRDLAFQRPLSLIESTDNGRQDNVLFFWSCASSIKSIGRLIYAGIDDESSKDVGCKKRFHQMKD